MITYLEALALTLAVEALVVAALASAPQRRQLVLASLFINLFTHPLANLAFTGTAFSFAGVEAAVVVVEALLYAWLAPAPGPDPGPRTLRRTALLSLAANAASAALSRLFW